MKVETYLTSFIERFIDSQRPVALALSGGIDSMVLFSHLIKRKEISLIVCHVDHGWREESIAESAALESLCKEKNVPFYVKRLTPNFDENLENQARNERMQFFQEVVEKTGAQGVFFAHHKDDLNETVLKRVFEGARLFSLFSMKEVTTFESMTIFRPFLSFSKKELTENYAGPFFHDKTNDDTTFLRARMRKEFFEKTFGKNISENLTRLSHDSSMLDDYLQRKTAKFFERKVKTFFGWYIDELSSEPLELHYFLMKHAPLSRKMVETAVEHLIKRSANIWVGSFFIDRGALFYVEKSTPCVEKKELKEGSFSIGPWRLTVRTAKEGDLIETGWRALLNGSYKTVIPKGKYMIYPLVDALDRKLFKKSGTKILKKILNREKVPHFLQAWVPAIVDDTFVVEDFLTEKGHLCDQNEEGFFLTLCF